MEYEYLNIENIQEMTLSVLPALYPEISDILDILEYPIEQSFWIALTEECRKISLEGGEYFVAEENFSSSHARGESGQNAPSHSIPVIPFSAPSTGLVRTNSYVSLSSLLTQPPTLERSSLRSRSPTFIGKMGPLSDDVDLAKILEGSIDQIPVFNSASLTEEEHRFLTLGLSDEVSRLPKGDSLSLKGKLGIQTDYKKDDLSDLTAALLGFDGATASAGYMVSSSSASASYMGSSSSASAGYMGRSSSASAGYMGRSSSSSAGSNQDDSIGSQLPRDQKCLFSPIPQLPTPLREGISVSFPIFFNSLIRIPYVLLLISVVSDEPFRIIKPDHIFDLISKHFDILEDLFRKYPIYCPSFMSSLSSSSSSSSSSSRVTFADFFKLQSENGSFDVKIVSYFASIYHYNIVGKSMSSSDSMESFIVKSFPEFFVEIDSSIYVLTPSKYDPLEPGRINGICHLLIKRMEEENLSLSNIPLLQTLNRLYLSSLEIDQYVQSFRSLTITNFAIVYQDLKKSDLEEFKLTFRLFMMTFILKLDNFGIKMALIQYNEGSLDFIESLMDLNDEIFNAFKDSYSIFRYKSDGKLPPVVISSKRFVSPATIDNSGGSTFTAGASILHQNDSYEDEDGDDF